MHWDQMSREQPRFAALGVQRLGDPGVVLVGTIRADGTPRISPVEPLFWNGDLWLMTKSHMLLCPRELIAYVDGQPVGWTRVGPRKSFPGVTGNRALARVLTEDPDAWWVTCFVVDSESRRHGVGIALLAAAVGFAREHGAPAVEGHPVDVAALSAARVGGSAIFTGTLAMFSAAGFAEVGRTYRSRPVMRLSWRRRSERAGAAAGLATE